MICGKLDNKEPLQQTDRQKISQKTDGFEIPSPLLDTDTTQYFQDLLL